MTITKVSRPVELQELVTVQPPRQTSRGSHVVVALVVAWLILTVVTLAVGLGSANRTGFVTTDVTTPSPSPVPAATYLPEV